MGGILSTGVSAINKWKAVTPLQTISSSYSIMSSNTCSWAVCHVILFSCAPIVYLCGFFVSSAPQPTSGINKGTAQLIHVNHCIYINLHLQGHQEPCNEIESLMRFNLRILQFDFMALTQKATVPKNEVQKSAVESYTHLILHLSTFRCFALFCCSYILHIVCI